MNLNLPVEANDFVKSLVAQGKYATEEAAVVEGIRLLMGREELRKKISVGVEQLDLGESFDEATVFEEVEAEIIRVESLVTTVTQNRLPPNSRNGRRGAGNGVLPVDVRAIMTSPGHGACLHPVRSSHPCLDEPCFCLDFKYQEPFSGVCCGPCRKTCVFVCRVHTADLAVVDSGDRGLLVSPIP